MVGTLQRFAHPFQARHVINTNRSKMATAADAAMRQRGRCRRLKQFCSALCNKAKLITSKEERDKQEKLRLLAAQSAVHYPPRTPVITHGDGRPLAGCREHYSVQKHYSESTTACRSSVQRAL
jgi:hypothetical protein